MKPDYRLNFPDDGNDPKLTIREDEVKLVLDRLPEESLHRFQVIHYHDRDRGVRWIGYINREAGEITVSPLPPGVRRIRFAIQARPTPRKRGQRRAPRRRGLIRPDVLFDVFVDELGHLQIVDESAHHVHMGSVHEPPERDYTDFWRLKLWSFRFDDVQNLTGPAEEEEISEVIDVTEESK